MSARNVILAVIGLAIVAGGAAYFMMKGANAPAGTAEESSPAVESGDATSVEPAVDDSAAAPESGVTGETESTEVPIGAEEPPTEAVDESAPMSGEAVDAFVNDAGETVIEGEEEIDETLEALPETPVEQPEDSNN